MKWRCEGEIPVLEGNAATIECRPWQIYDGGDHLIVIGEVIDLEINDIDPLLFISGKFHHAGTLYGGTTWEASGHSIAHGWFEDLPRSTPSELIYCGTETSERHNHGASGPQRTTTEECTRRAAFSAAARHINEGTVVMTTEENQQNTMSERTTPANPKLPMTGDEYIDSLRDGREIYLHGERVEDVTTHPAFRNSVRMVARLYDGFHDEATADKLLVDTDTGSGGKTHPFFKIPKSVDDLKDSRTAIETWARISYGWLGRSPDYKAASSGLWARCPTSIRPTRRTPSVGTRSHRRRPCIGITPSSTLLWTVTYPRTTSKTSS